MDDTEPPTDLLLELDWIIQSGALLFTPNFTDLLNDSRLYHLPDQSIAYWLTARIPARLAPRPRPIHNGSTSWWPWRSLFLARLGTRDGVECWCDGNKLQKGLQSAFQRVEGFETDFQREFQVVFRLSASGPPPRFSLRPSELAWCRQSSTLPSWLLAALLNRRLEPFPNGFSHARNR